MHQNNEWRKQYFVARLTYMAFIASLFIYALVAEILSTQAEGFPVPVIPDAGYANLRFIFYGISIILIIVLRSLRRSLLKKIPLYTRSIVTVAICEVPAILGLVLFMLTRIKRDFYFLLIISLFLLFMYFPRHSQWEEDSKQR